MFEKLSDNLLKIKIVKSLFDENHLKSWVVLIADLIVSAIAMFLSVVFFELVFDKAYPDSFIIYATTIFIGSSLIVFLLAKTYKRIIRHSGLIDVVILTAAVTLSEIIFLAVFYLFLPSFCDTYKMPFLAVLSGFMQLFGLLCMRGLMIGVYSALKKITYGGAVSARNTLIFGTNEESVIVSHSLNNSKKYNVCGFLSMKINDKDFIINDFHVYFVNDALQLGKILRKNNISFLLFPSLVEFNENKAFFVNSCVESGVKIIISQDVISSDVINNENQLRIREMNIEDLLGRDVINLSNKNAIVNEYSGKTVLITGAAGSTGSELCRILASIGNVSQIILYDSAETPVHNLRLELASKFKDISIIPLVGDVRSQWKLVYVFQKYHPQIVIHAAAYKHVPLMEENPCEAIIDNVFGTKHVADAAVNFDAEKMIMVSTDKAVNPTNVMGATKRLAEMYVQSLGHSIKTGEVLGTTKFITTRFGNVLGSNGSVIPLFKEQISKGGPLTVTHPEINRFFMSIPEACRLVLTASSFGEGGDIFMFDMGKPVKIVDLAKKMIELSGYSEDDIKIEFTGLRPGEKLYEEVLASEENTLPTSNIKIRRANVRPCNYGGLCDQLDKLYGLALRVQVTDSVKLLKEIVPEFKSQNSKFHELDC